MLCLRAARAARATRTFWAPQVRSILTRPSQPLHAQVQKLLKRETITLVRLSTNNNAVQKNTSKAVGYWLLSCSGMVFVAVVLGTITGYLVLLYSICYVLDIVIRKSVK